MAGAANDEEDHRNEPPAKHKHTRNVRIDESINEVVQKEVRRQGVVTNKVSSSIVSVLALAPKDPAKKDEPERPKNDDLLGPVGSTPGELAKFLRSESARWARIIKEVGVKAE